MTRQASSCATPRGGAAEESIFMRAAGRILGKVLSAALILSGTACTFEAPPPTYSFTLPPGGACEMLKIPEPWLLQTFDAIYSPDGMAPAHRYDQVELRDLDGKVAIAVLSAHASRKGKTSYSKKYSFDPGDATTIRAISDADWSRAYAGEGYEKPVGNVTASTPTSFDYGDSIDYQGNRLAGSGEHLFPGDRAALLSRDQQWVALQSYNGPVGLGARRGGAFYVDVFAAASGKKRFTLGGEASSGAPYLTQENTKWTHGKYLFLDPMDDRGSFIICDPARPHR